VHSALFVENHIASLTNLTASTTYYIVVSSTDESGNTATSSETSFTTPAEDIEEPEDETAPVISNLSTTAATTTATIEWDTDEAASSKIWYSTTTPVDLLNDPFVSSDTLVTNHTLSLTDLSPGIPYYIVVSSTDEAGNMAASGETSFTTLAEEVVDVTPPVISGIAETNTTASSTEISWTTNEEATSKVWYGTTTPLVITNETLLEEDTSLVQSHSLTLSGLTASTTYHYLVSSADEADNTATSTETSFTTSP